MKPNHDLLAAVADRPVADLIADLDRRLERLHERVAVVERAASPPQPPPADDLGGYGDGPDLLALTLNGKLAAALVAADFGSLAAVRAASDADLLAVHSIDAKALKLIRSRVGGPEA